jgi:DeoR family fructose operon transcriptional repressor
MNAFLRQEKIVNLVRRNASMQVTSLVDTLQMSPATVRRDLARLEQTGRIIRTHGAVLDPASVGGEPSLEIKRGRWPEEKRRIASRVAEQIPPGSTVFVDAGSTCLEVGILLLARKDCDLYSNSIPLARYGSGSGRHLTLIGGSVRGLTGALIGAPALAWLAELRFDVAVLGASALDLTSGGYTTEMEEASVKRAAAFQADRVILAADHSKFNEQAPVRFLTWEKVDCLVTDTEVALSESGQRLPRIEIAHGETP